MQELLNGCICCNLVGQLGDALETLRNDVNPDRIVIETSGSAFPATLAIEVNRLASETGNYIIDGVIVVIDVENWQGYEDTSYTAKMQARYTDLIVFNKWERVDERRYDDCLDRIGDLDVPVGIVKSDKGKVDKDVLLGLDGSISKDMTDLTEVRSHEESEHDHAHDHQAEVEVLSVTLTSQDASKQSANLDSLETFLLAASKQEIYRIKALLKASHAPSSSGGEVETAIIHQGEKNATYILNWAFGRWNFTPLCRVLPRSDTNESSSSSKRSSIAVLPEGSENDDLVRMTVVLARGEANSWKKRIEDQGYIETEKEDSSSRLEVKRIL